METVRAKLLRCEDVTKELAAALNISSERMRSAADHAEALHLRQQYRKVILDLADIILAADEAMLG